MTGPTVTEPTPAPSPARRPASGRSLAARHLALAGVLAVSALLNLVELSQNGWANTYYSAAVKSMLGSWHNFVFVSFDPGGLVSVDKPPLALWVQAVSAKVFGFSSLSLLVPEALAGVLSVAILYRVVRPRFGTAAALLAALVLATFPSFVAIARDNNPDALLILLLTAACWAGLTAADRGQTRWLLASAALVGLAFNTKMLAAYLVVPGLAAGWITCAPGPPRQRLGALAIAAAMLVVTSGAWIAAVDLTPGSVRPYVASTLDNSELTLALDYNGIGRVGGQLGTPGAASGAFPGATHGPGRAPAPARLIIGNGRSNVSSAGPAGPLRLFDRALGGQGAWLLLLALAGGVATAAQARGRRDPRLAALIVFGGWLAAEAVVVSFSRGIVHPYYVSALAPGVAALAGAGVPALAALARRAGPWLLVPALGLAGSAVVEILLLRRASYLAAWVPVLALATLAALAVAAIRGRLARPAVALAVAALLVAPAAYASTVWDRPVVGTFPAAGPTMPAPAERGRTALLAHYVRTHRPGSELAILTQSALGAAPFILDHALRAGALGGFNAADSGVSARRLALLVERDAARYVLIGGAEANDAIRAVERACRALPESTWNPSAAQLLPSSLAAAGETLYDCRGRGSSLASSARGEPRR